MNGIKYRKAEEMKDSGIEWLGMMPKEWNMKKMNWLFRNIRTGATPDTSIFEYYDNGDINWLLTGDLNDSYIYETSKKITKVALKKVSALKNNPKDTLVIAMYGATIGKLGITKIETTTNQACCCFTNPINISAKYIYYWFLGNRNHIVNMGYGGGQPNISKDLLLNLRVSIGSQNDQKSIANFLDIKTAQFDSIISKKELLIKKLDEAKKSLISEVVTGKVKIVDGEMVERKPEDMKNSGVEWLGMIPKDWEVKRIKNIFSLRNERNHKSMNEVQILSLYTALGVKRQEEIENRTGNIVRTVMDYKIVHPKDIVVNIILAWMGAIGVSKDSGVISPAYDIYKPFENINSDYYSYLFRTSKFAGECFKYGRGIMLMRWRTYSDQFMSLYCCCPNKEEQDEIADFIDRKNQEIEIVVEKNKSQIQKLKEAKQSLISKAVTGKIDLRDWEIIEEGGLQ